MTRTTEQLSGGYSKESLLDLAFDKNVNVETSKQIAAGYKSAQQHSSTAAAAAAQPQETQAATCDFA